MLLLPPAPAARVLAGLLADNFSALSAAAFRRIAVFGPPGGVGEDGRAVVEPTEGEELRGELEGGDDCVGDVTLRSSSTTLNNWGTEWRTGSLVIFRGIMGHVHTILENYLATIVLGVWQVIDGV